MKLRQLINEDDIQNTQYARGKKTISILVEPTSDGFYRAKIEKVNDKIYSGAPGQPTEFIGIGKTIKDSILDLGKKMKM